MDFTAIGNRFYGRKQELELLHQLQADVRDRGISRFVVVTGRRRIGKTRLIEEALPNSLISTYIASQLSNSNLMDYVADNKSALNIPYPLAISTWEPALQLVFLEAQRRSITLVFDEFQNFSTVGTPLFIPYKNFGIVITQNHESSLSHVGRLPVPCATFSKIVKHYFLQ